MEFRKDNKDISYEQKTTIATVQTTKQEKKKKKKYKMFSSPCVCYSVSTYCIAIDIESEYINKKKTEEEK